jgi:alpha-tubulin suppressor-like RCC1 family protein
MQKNMFNSLHGFIATCMILVVTGISCSKSASTTNNSSATPSPSPTPTPTPSSILVSTNINSQLSTIATNPTTIFINQNPGVYTTNSVTFTNTATNATVTINTVIAPVAAPFSLVTNTCQNTLAPGASCTLSYVLSSSATTQSISQTLPQLAYTDASGSYTTTSLGSWFIDFREFKFLNVVVGKGNHSCGIGIDHKLYCWGSNIFGQLGIGNRNSQSIPTLVSSMSKSTITQLVLGVVDSCAVSGSTELYCWGNNNYGQLGIGDERSNQLIPVLVPFMSKSTITHLSLGLYHSCAVSGSTELYCWGDNDYGQLGIGNTNDQFEPALVPSMSKSTITHLALGYYHSCAVSGSTELYCWGRNNNGQLGIGTTTNTLIPDLVSGMSKSTITHLDVGYYHSCAVSDSTELYCWGRNDYGQLGVGNTNQQLVPTNVYAISNSTITDLHLGGYHSCAVSGSTELYCWGSDTFGQLGLGEFVDNQLVPTLVPFMSANIITSLALGEEHSCAVKNTQLYCWGHNDAGQLGVGDTNGRFTPTQVLDPIF